MYSNSTKICVSPKYYFFILYFATFLNIGIATTYVNYYCTPTKPQRSLPFERYDSDVQVHHESPPSTKYQDEGHISAIRGVDASVSRHPGDDGDKGGSRIAASSRAACLARLLRAQVHRDYGPVGTASGVSIG